MPEITNVSSTISTDKESSAVGSTPMLKQYQAIKLKHQNCILFYRLGDFYEMFFEDAKIGSKVLDLVLTSRGKGAGSKVPMCGIPYHSAENYIAKLVKAGYKVAICEQIQDTAEAKGIVERDVTRIISAGTYLSDQDHSTRYIAALFTSDKSYGLSFLDPTSGTILSNEYPKDTNRLINIIAKLPIFECVYPQSMQEELSPLLKHSLIQHKDIVLSPAEDWMFNTELTKKSLCDHFNVANLHGFGIASLPSAISSTGALLEYLKYMNKQPLRHVDKISLYIDDDYLYISPAAIRGLEIPNLIKTLDQTQTALGRRKFHHWFMHPLKHKQPIEERQQAIELLMQQPKLSDELKNILARIPDLERNISRLSCGLTHPRDLLSIRNTLAEMPELKKVVAPLSEHNALFEIKDVPELRDYLCKTINSSIPLAKPDGKVIAQGVSDELDELKGLQENGRQFLVDLQAREIKDTGISSLKIGFNKVFGYYLEATKLHSEKVPEHYIRKQTLVNAERYITPELKEYEEKILSAEEKINKIESKLINQATNEILANSKELHQLADAIASIDALHSLSALASSANYCKPTITEDLTLNIAEGRHPVVEKTSTETFVANDTVLNGDDQHLIILTGPNMSGKSTYIRQTAILTIMSQIGSFIPAQTANIGLVDKVFTRIGAHDDISKGQSTFMVEMNETADILNNLTPQSLVILDEIGRGTSTYDGLSLAWALAEHLQSLKVRTLFATHFHELTALSEKFTGVKNYNVAVKEWKDEIIFMHKIVEGGTDDSYGIYVAKLAGISNQIITRAKKILSQLELKNDIRENLKSNFTSEEQLNFFAQSSNPTLDEIKEDILKTDIDQCTPVEALNKIQQWKENLEES